MKNISLQVKLVSVLILFCIFIPSQIIKAAGEIGLAKKAEITNITASGANSIQVTYTIINSGSEDLTQINLTDDYRVVFGMINPTGTMSNFNITVHTGGAPASDINLPVNASYAGYGNLIQNGTMKSGTSATVIMTFDVKLTDKFGDNTIITNSANISAWDSSGNEVQDTSTDGDIPTPGNRFPTATIIPLTQIVIQAVGSTGLNNNTAPPSTTVSETAGTMTYIVKRKGYVAQVSKVELNLQPSGANPATLGTSAATNVDVWRNPVIETLTFSNNEREKTITINLVDDDMYEDNEFFDIWLKTPTSQYTNKDFNNVSILIPQVKVTITSDDPEPVINISSNSSLQILEGSGGGSTVFTVDVTLSNASSKTVSINWKIPGAGASFTGAVQGTVSFPPGSKKQTITVYINKDNLYESDEKYKIQLSGPQNGKMGNPSHIEFKIIDDDLRQIQWLNSTPKSRTGRLDAGSNITDTVELHFMVIEAPLSNPKVVVKLPAGITYVNYQNLNDDANTVSLGTPVVTGTVATGLTLTFTPAANPMLQNQKAHIKIVQKAECNAATGLRYDEVRVIADGDPNGVEEMTAPNKIGTGARVKYANFNVYIGKLSLLWKQGEGLSFDKNEIGTAKKQALSISNNGQGRISSFDFSVKFPSGIGTLQNAIIRGTTRAISFTGPTSSGGFDTYKVTVTAADFAFIGNKNNVFDGGEEIIIEYDFQTSTTAKCGIKTQTLWVDWNCQKPATTLNTTISLYEPQGKPELERTIKTPHPIVEDGSTPNNFIVELKNTGKADAYNVKIPLSVSGEGESFNMANVTIVVNGIPSNTAFKTPVNPKSMTITNLVIPSGETAVITFPVVRSVLNRYATKTKMLDAGYFSNIYCGDITYTDECEDPLKAGRIGYSYFNSFKSDGTSVGSNISYMPQLMTTDIARIDISSNAASNRRTIGFELGSINTVFPIEDALTWFGGKVGSSESSVVVTLNLTPNISLVSANLKNAANVSSPALAFTVSGNTYTINIPYTNYYQYFRKNGKLEMELEGSCSGGSNVNTISYTVDFITNQNVRHGFYKNTFEVLVKCDIDPGANLRLLTAKRVNYLKGDSNNNGILENATDGAINNNIMRLDRLYHNDTIEFQYIVRIGQHNVGYVGACVPTAVEPWNILYVTAGNINSTNLQHFETTYSIYDASNAPVVNNQAITPSTQGAGKDYFMIDRSGLPHKFEHKDSIVVRSLWVAKTITGGQWERSDQLQFWTYCEMLPRTDVFAPRATDPPCDYLGQNYEKEFANITFFSLSPATNGASQYKYEFLDLYQSKDAKYDHHLSVGYRGYNNVNFPYELRQPYYIDNMEFELPYGYRITGNIQFFGYASRADLAYARYPKYTGIITPEMQGNPHNISLTGQWDLNIWDDVVTGSQIADEGWVVQPFITLDVTPKANPGESVITFKLNYESPTNINPFVYGSASNTSLSEPGFILYNNAASFVITCGAPETIAYSDTVRWPIRIANNSSKKDVKDGWIYIDGVDMRLVKLIDKSTGTEINGEAGFEGKWLKVADVFPKETYRDYYLVSRYTQYHCDNDTLKVWPWHNYKEVAGETPLTLYTTNPLDTADFHVGRSVDLYVVNQQSAISGRITALEDTPVDPANAASAPYGSQEIPLGQEIPVEIQLSSDDIIAVKEIGLTLNIPQGLKYVPSSAYYDWKGTNQPFKTAAETKMGAINGVGAPVNILWDEITGQAGSQLAGTYKTLQNEREVWLRFKLASECTGFNADSVVLTAQLFGKRLCDAPAIGNGDTISGRQIYVQGYRYYQMRNDIFTPNGNVFALCDDARATRTIQVSFTRIGGGELQDDIYELLIPDHFDLDGVNPVKYLDPGIDITDNPIVISNTTNNGLRTIHWELPRDYSRQYTNNITVEYSVDLKLDVNAPNLPDNDTIVANVLAQQVLCPGDTNLLSTDTLNIFIYNAKIGLAKDVVKSAPTADGYVPVTYTYTITNYSNTNLVGVQLSDDLIGMFGNLVELKNQFTITSSSTDLVVDPTYVGMGNIIQSGEIAGGTTETVTLQIWAKPTFDYDGRVFENNAYIRSANIVGCEANDSSTVGRNPASPDLDPYLNAVPTPLWFNIIRFKHNPPEFRVPESIGDLVFTVERVGQDFSPAEVDIKLENEAVQISGTEAAKLGTSNTYPIDAWWNESSLSKTLGFAQDEKEKQVTIHIVDDKIYETLETFLAILVNQRYLSSTDVLSLMNDSIHVTIEDNDKRPTLNITAVADSILEGTIPPAPFGCTNMGFQLKLTNPTYQEVKVDWQTTTGGTGVAGTDFRPQTQITATIAPEDTVLVVNVCVIADNIPEASKTVEVETITGTFINATAPTNAANRRAMATIIDDDLVITLVKLKHLTCKGDASGEIIIQVAGGDTGTGSYTYSWTGPNGFSSSNDTITKLAAGVYTVTVKDKHATTVTASYTVEEPANKLAITVGSVKNATCYGDSDGLINTTISGGWNSPNYTIGWTKLNSTYTASTNNISGLTAGKYVLTVSDSAQCVVVDSIALAEPLPISVADTVIHDVTCMGASDGSIKITPSGGNAPYFIYWEKGGSAFANNVETISGLSPDTYTVTIGDSKLCPQAKSTFVIRGPATVLSAYIDTLVNVACMGDASGKVVIKAEGGWGKYTYEWSDGVITGSNTRNDLLAMNYSVIVTDSAGCSKTLSPISIIEPATRMDVTLVATDGTYQNSNDGTITVTVTGGVPAYHYSWDDMPTLDTDYRNFLRPGTYTVTVTDQWNCVMSASAVITEPKVIDNLPSAFTPDGDGFNDKLLQGFHIQVFDRWGLLLYEGTDGWDGRYKGKMVTAGTYFYVLIDDTTGQVYKSAVLLQRVK